jgi:transposase
VSTVTGRRRRWSIEEKIAIAQESLIVSETVSDVARRHGLNRTQLFRWRRLYRCGALHASIEYDDVMPVFKLSDALIRIKELQRLLGKTTMELEILRQVTGYGRAKKTLPARPPQL